MNKVGEIIKSARIANKFSIQEISKELNISKSIIEDFEADKKLNDYDMVFYIGHLRSYCNFLNLNTNDVIFKFKSQNNLINNQINQELAKPVSESDFTIFKKILPVSLILIIFSTFYFLFVKEENSKQYALIPELPESFIPIIEKANLENPQFNQTVKNEIIEDKNISSSSAIASNKNSNENLNNIVTLKLLNPTWLQLRDESNNIIISKLMEKNEEFSYEMKLGYTITAGNAGNILVIIDSDVRGKIGKYGEIVDSVTLDNNFNN